MTKVFMLKEIDDLEMENGKTYFLCCQLTFSWSLVFPERFFLLCSSFLSYQHSTFDYSTSRVALFTKIYRFINVE
jgi:hypothetical protein